LDGAPQRAFDILMAVAAVPRICIALEAAGLDEAELDVAWTLLRELKPPVAAFTPERDEEVLAARAYIDAAGPSFRRRVEYAARRVDADLAESLCRGLTGRAAQSVPVLLDRLAALDEHAPAAAALRTRLRARGLDALADELRAAVRRARGFGAAPLPPEAPPHDRDAILIALHAWVREWSEIARAVLPLRLDHIRLGIAKMRKPSDA
jgi:hypothetical protein